MISQIDNDVALTVLRKYDAQCQMILDYCNKIKLYNYDKTKNNWVIQDESEGAFYLVKRNIPPIYKFVILGKYNKPGSYLSTTEIPLSQYLISQIHQTFYMFKNEFGIIQAILFPNKLDCERFYTKVEKIIKELKTESSKNAGLANANCKPRFVESIDGILSNHISSNSQSAGSDKILNMLESARQRYEDIHVEKWSRQIDIKELFKSTTGTHSEPMTPVMVNSMSSYTLPPQTSTRPQVIDCEINPIRPIIPQTGQLPENANPQTMSSKNGPNTLTVTELEKYFVQKASTNQTNVERDEDDDDSLLLGPNRFEQINLPLDRDQLKEAMIQMLQNDRDGSFLAQLHSAYLESYRNSSAARK